MKSFIIVLLSTLVPLVAREYSQVKMASHEREETGLTHSLSLPSMLVKMDVSRGSVVTFSSLPNHSVRFYRRCEGLAHAVKEVIEWR